MLRGRSPLITDSTILDGEGRTGFLTGAAVDVRVVVEVVWTEFSSSQISASVRCLMFADPSRLAARCDSAMAVNFRGESPRARSAVDCFNRRVEEVMGGRFVRTLARWFLISNSVTESPHAGTLAGTIGILALPLRAAADRCGPTLRPLGAPS